MLGIVFLLNCFILNFCRGQQFGGQGTPQHLKEGTPGTFRTMTLPVQIQKGVGKAGAGNVQHGKMYTSPGVTSTYERPKGSFKMY